MRKKWGNRIGAIVLACALTVNGLPEQSISTSTRKAYAAAKSETEKQRKDPVKSGDGQLYCAEQRFFL